MVELGNMSLSELRQLQEDVKNEMKRREEDLVAQARQQIIAIADSVGIPLHELFAKKGAKVGAGTKAAIRFRHPENDDQQWSGRGREPKWIKDWRDSGKSLDQLRV